MIWDCCQLRFTEGKVFDRGNVNRYQSRMKTSILIDFLTS